MANPVAVFVTVTQQGNKSLFSKVITCILFLNNRLPVALHLLHNDLLLLWQKHLRDAIFPYCCMHIHTQTHTS